MENHSSLVKEPTSRGFHVSKKVCIIIQLQSFEILNYLNFGIVVICIFRNKITIIYDFQVGYVLGFIVIASIILVGLLVYYVGVMNVSNELDNCLSTTAATSTTSKPVKEKV